MSAHTNTLIITEAHLESYVVATAVRHASLSNHQWRSLDAEGLVSMAESYGQRANILRATRYADAELRLTARIAFRFAASAYDALRNRAAAR
jgi:hypothetical protein